MAEFTPRFDGNSRLDADFGTDTKFMANFGVIGGGLSLDYNKINNKPSINGVEIVGTKTAHDYGLANESDIPDVSDFATKDELDLKADKTEIPDVSNFVTENDVSKDIDEFYDSLCPTIKGSGSKGDGDEIPFVSNKTNVRRLFEEIEFNTTEAIKHLQILGSGVRANISIVTFRVKDKDGNDVPLIRGDFRNYDISEDDDGEWSFRGYIDSGNVLLSEMTWFVNAPYTGCAICYDRAFYSKPDISWDLEYNSDSANLQNNQWSLAYNSYIVFRLDGVTDTGSAEDVKTWLANNNIFVPTTKEISSGEDGYVLDIQWGSIPDNHDLTLNVSPSNKLVMEDVYLYIYEYRRDARLVINNQRVSRYENDAAYQDNIKVQNAINRKAADYYTKTEIDSMLLADISEQNFGGET